MASRSRNPYIDYSVYLIVRTVVCIVQMLNVRSAYAFADLIALLGYTVDKRHRKVADENLRHAFGKDLTPERRRRMVFEVYRHFARVIVEIALIPRKMHVTNWKKFVSLENSPRAVDCIMADRGKILVTAHFGNWEMAGYFVAAIGIKAFAIARELDNPYLHDFLLRFRQFTGQTILSKNGDFDRIQHVLTTDQFLISVGDQSAGPRGYFVDFFNRPASTHKAIAILSIRHDSPVMVGFGYRDRPGFHYTVGISKLLDPRDYAHLPNAALAMTEDVSKALEEMIRRAPEQYLWLHNRWKHQPPDAKKKLAAAAA